MSESVPRTEAPTERNFALTSSLASMVQDGGQPTAPSQRCACGGSTRINQRAGELISAVSVTTYQSVHRVKAASPSL
jgi:hypothetical protein